LSTAVFAEDSEVKVDDRLDASAETLSDMMHASDKGIPKDLLDKARCVVVVPGMKKAGFIFGAKYGRGFAVCRRQGGSAASSLWLWHPVSPCSGHFRGLGINSQSADERI
jgi:lipid-binding SYLF domain-containing protein